MGYNFDYGEFHANVHTKLSYEMLKPDSKLPYEMLKPDPVLRNLLISMPHRKT